MCRNVLFKLRVIEEMLQNCSLWNAEEFSNLEEIEKYKLENATIWFEFR